MELLEVRRAKRAFSTAEQAYSGARHRLSGVDRLLALPVERRARWIPLIREQWLLAVAEQPGTALPAIAEAALSHPDAAPDAFADRALDVWLTQGPALTAAELAGLDRRLAPTGRGLDARLTVLCTGRTAPDPSPHFRGRLADARILRDLADPPMALLVALGPLDEADWWCEIGRLAAEEGRYRTAREHFRRAAELGCTEVRPFVAYLELSRVQFEDERPQRVRRALIAARELHPDPSPELLLYLGCRALQAGLATDLEELAALDVERTDLRDLWLAVAALRERRPAGARRRLRAALDGRTPLDGPVHHSEYAFRQDPDEDEVQEFAERLLLLLARKEHRQARKRLTPENLERLLPDLYGLAPTSLRHREAPEDSRHEDAVPPLDSTD